MKRSDAPAQLAGLYSAILLGQPLDDFGRTKTRILAKVESPCRADKSPSSRMEVRHLGLIKNAEQLSAVFALSNLWMVRQRLFNSTRNHFGHDI
jgi:hypothetical protein